MLEYTLQSNYIIDFFCFRPALSRHQRLVRTAIKFLMSVLVAASRLPPLTMAVLPTVARNVGIKTVDGLPPNPPNKEEEADITTIAAATVTTNSIFRKTAIAVPKHLRPTTVILR